MAFPILLFVRKLFPSWLFPGRGEAVGVSYVLDADCGIVFATGQDVTFSYLRRSGGVVYGIPRWRRSVEVAKEYVKKTFYPSYIVIICETGRVDLRGNSVSFRVLHAPRIISSSIDQPSESLITLRRYARLIPTIKTLSSLGSLIVSRKLVTKIEDFVESTAELISFRKSDHRETESSISFINLGLHRVLTPESATSQESKYALRVHYFIQTNPDLVVETASVIRIQRQLISNPVAVNSDSVNLFVGYAISNSTRATTSETAILQINRYLIGIANQKESTIYSFNVRRRIILESGIVNTLVNSIDSSITPYDYRNDDEDFLLLLEVA